MTPDQQRIVEAFTTFQVQHCPDFEDFLDALAASFREQAKAEPYPEVAVCLHGVAEHLQFASVDFYASTK